MPSAQKVKWAVLATFLIMLIGVLDWVTGYDLNFFVFYFLPVSISAWMFGTSGFVLSAAACSVVWFAAFDLSGLDYPSRFMAVWNTIIRLISFLAIGWSVSSLKSILDKEKITSARLRSSIQAHQEAQQKLRELNATLERQVARRTALAETRAKKLQELTVQVIEAEERERQRLAQILHDDLQQLLAAARMQAEVVGNRLHAASELTAIRQLLTESIDKSRNLAQELSPPILRRGGLPAALRWLAENMKKQFGLSVAIEMAGGQGPEGELLKGFVFRAAQELLFNVVKHSGARDAKMIIKQTQNDMTIVISDNGKGFDPEAVGLFSDKATGFGLLSISERAGYFGGNLAIRSAPGHGSRFTLTVPLKGPSTVIV